MTTVNFNQSLYELARERQQHLLQEAAQQRQLQALRPAVKPLAHKRQPFALLRTWRLVPPRLQLTGPADEASCS